MSLNFDYKNVKNWEQMASHPAYPDVWHPVGESLVWMSMVCGYNHITAANAQKIAQRLMEYQAIKGPLLSYSMSDDVNDRQQRKLYIDLPEVQAYIGLRTNASSKTDREWNKHLLDIISTTVGDIRYGKKTSALEQFDKDCQTLNARKEK